MSHFDTAIELLETKARLARLEEALREIADAACANRITISGRLSECADVSDNPGEWCVVCRSRAALAEEGNKNPDGTDRSVLKKMGY